MPSSLLIPRRSLLLALAATWPALALPSPTRRQGRLVVIGGAEDRLHDKIILRKFIELCGGPDARIKLITAASGDPEGTWRGYEPVFKELGVAHCEPVPLFTRDDANDPAVVSQILDTDGLFMTGGDQNRLMEILWETAAARAIHVAFHVNGCCIGGTSAGAAVMSRQMLAQGSATRLPEKDAVVMDIGLGLVSKAIIDQHFSERLRLGRLLSALAQRPDMLGVGIDENTALIIERGKAIEVIGQGAVTLINGRQMRSNFEDVETRDRLEMLGVQMHLLPAGHRYVVTGPVKRPGRLPPSLLEALTLLVALGPMRG